MLVLHSHRRVSNYDSAPRLPGNSLPFTPACLLRAPNSLQTVEILHTPAAVSHQPPQWLHVFGKLSLSLCFHREPTSPQEFLTRLSAPDSSSSSPLGSSRNWITLTLFKLVSVQLSSTLFCKRFSGEEENTVGAPFGKSRAVDLDGRQFSSHHENDLISSCIHCICPWH